MDKIVDQSVQSESEQYIYNPVSVCEGMGKQTWFSTSAMVNYYTFWKNNVTIVTGKA